MNKATLFLLSPAASGLFLLIVSLVDLALFKSGFIGVRTMLTWELPLVLICFGLGCAAILKAVLLLFKRQWLHSIALLGSVLVMLIFHIVAGVNGAAFLNAT